MKFLKTTIALTGVMAAMAFAPEASAIPAFARQVGMACSACHYQHFPSLNSFGRSFKEAGYTMVGAQDKIEGDGISLPATLNAALVGQAGYTKTNGSNAGAPSTPSSKNSNDGQLTIPSAASLFLGGRAGEHVGFESEIQVASGGTQTTAGLIRLKVPFVFDVGSVKAGIVPFATNGLGAADSFEVLNTGAVAVHAFNQVDMPAISAQQYINTAQPAHGVAFIASNDNFFANVAKWGASEGNGAAGAPTSTYVRAAWTTDLIPGFDSAIGFQNWSGTSTTTTTGTYASSPFSVGTAPTTVTGGTTYDTKASSIDAQTMGDVAGMPLLVIASYAKASTNGTAVTQNLFNLGTFDRKSFNIGAELGVIPNKATVQLGIRRASSGIDASNVGGTAGTNASDNAVLVGATYAIALNVRAELTYSKYSGDLYGAKAQAQALTNAVTYVGDSKTTLDLVFGF